MECPVTYDRFTESGDRQPLILPACGHTICRRAVRTLVDQAQLQCGGRKTSVAIKCPCCAKLQPKMLSSRDFPANWAVIEHLRDEADAVRNLSTMQVTETATAFTSSPQATAARSSGSLTQLTPQDVPRLNADVEEVTVRFRTRRNSKVDLNAANRPEQQPELLRRRHAGELSGSGRMRYVNGSRSSTVSVPGSEASDTVFRSPRSTAGRAPLGALDMNDPMTIAAWLDTEQIRRHFTRIYLPDFPLLISDFSEGLTHSEIVSNRSLMLRHSLTHIMCFHMSHWTSFSRLSRTLSKTVRQRVVGELVGRVLGSEHATFHIVEAYAFDATALGLIAEFWPADEEGVPTRDQVAEVVAASTQEVEENGEDHRRCMTLSKSNLPNTTTLAVHLEEEFFGVFREFYHNQSGRQCMPATTAFLGAVFKQSGVLVTDIGSSSCEQETARAAEAAFQWLCSHVASSDSLMALFGTCRHQMPLVLDMCMVKVAGDCFPADSE